MVCGYSEILTGNFSDSLYRSVPMLTRAKLGTAVSYEQDGWVTMVDGVTSRTTDLVSPLLGYKFCSKARCSYYYIKIGKILQKCDILIVLVEQFDIGDVAIPWNTLEVVALVFALSEFNDSIPHFVWREMFEDDRFHRR